MNHELNKQIAKEVMGWTKLSWWYPIVGIPPDAPAALDGKQEYVKVPDYSGSLDAAHQVESQIYRDELQDVYVDQLTKIVGSWPLDSHYALWILIHATPKQRCRAALEAVREK